MRRFAGSASIYLGANIVSAAIPFLLLPLLTRLLSPVDYGIVALFGVATSILAAFTGLSVHGAIAVRYFQLEPQRFAHYVGACFRILAVSATFVGLLIAFATPWLEELVQIPPLWLLAAGLMSAAQVATNIRLSMLQVQDRAFAYGLLQCGQAALNIGLSLLFVVVLHMAWQGRVLGQVMATILLMSVALLWMPKGEVMCPVGKDDTKDALRFGVPLIPHVLGGLLIAATDRMMIANMIDVGQAGIYMVALQVGMVMGVLTESFNKVYAPKLLSALVRVDPHRDRRIVRGTYLYFVGVAGIAIVLGTMAPLLLKALVGEQFRAAADSVFYVALGYAFSGMYYMVTIYMFFASKTAQLALVTLACGAFNVIATWYLIGANGVVGAAQAFMLSQALLFIGTWWLSHRAHPMPWRRALFSVST